MGFMGQECVLDADADDDDEENKKNESNINCWEL
jgi:hypothetical protein